MLRKHCGAFHGRRLSAPVYSEITAGERKCRCGRQVTVLSESYATIAVCCDMSRSGPSVAGALRLEDAFKLAMTPYLQYRHAISKSSVYVCSLTVDWRQQTPTLPSKRYGRFRMPTRKTQIALIESLVRSADCGHGVHPGPQSSRVIHLPTCITADPTIRVGTYIHNHLAMRTKRKHARQPAVHDAGRDERIGD